MLLELVNSWWMAIVLCCLGVTFIFAVTIRLDNKLICSIKTFNNGIERNPRTSSQMVHLFLQTTPMISSFLCLVVMILGFVVYIS